jgi:hypothetical protein
VNGVVSPRIVNCGRERPASRTAALPVGEESILPTAQEAGWPAQPIWMQRRKENPCPVGNRIPEFQSTTNICAVHHYE